MPLQSSHVFASHIGHTGKTTLCFQMSCLYAKQNPEIKVLVMDLAEEGDLSKRLMGGVEQSAKTQEVFGGVFSLLQDATDKTAGITSWLWAPTLDLAKHAIQVSTYNKKVPENLLLISSGAYPAPDERMEFANRKKICDKIRDSLEKDTATSWKLFCDTDGDRRPSPNTLIGYQLCDYAIVPLHLNRADLDRTETMLAVMDDLRTNKKEINTRVALLVWNFVKTQKDEPCTHKGNDFPFTPQKVSLEILDAVNKKVYDINGELPNLFVSSGKSEEEFTKASTTILRQVADNVLKPSEEMGYPWCQMMADLGGKKSQKYTSGGVEYSASADVIEHCTKNLDVIYGKLEASCGAGSSGGYPSS